MMAKELQILLQWIFLQGVDVITSGNHIWNKKETIEFIN